MITVKTVRNSYNLARERKEKIGFHNFRAERMYWMQLTLRILNKTNSTAVSNISEVYSGMQKMVEISGNF